MTSIWVTWPALVKYGTLGILAGLLTLAVERNELFENNLFDFERWDEYNADIECDERSLTARMETVLVTSLKTLPRARQTDALVATLLWTPLMARQTRC
ncbi:MAG: hypothetical protein VYB48_13810 [Pseudomonadota bacterium]|nr:hypothetical protein [Pseudomonadota bacterium]MEC8102856.1 hypothetical protein [Pseudomonadota bacterium]